ncbi:N-acetyltransferase [Cyclobacterium sp. SYSU L10401]|uniref:N-acetyltransferase n=1 Tax=Cyclobacterium sp. SYSU L10401 TaxID=2678657 RepID=UPI0013D6CC0B|nr:N-acetyltransferase [Cyclobacterium sp. SYSU L10401]
MKIIETSTGEKRLVDILPVEIDEFKTFKKERYFFDWKKEKHQEVYKLQIKGMSDVFGLVSIERIPEEWRIHIRLLTVSKENKGKEKKYDKIIGNLMAFVAKIALREFGELACVSLRPKSQIARHYMETYNMNLTGLTLSMEIPQILALINLYDND